MSDTSDRERAFEAVLSETESLVRAYIAGLGVPLDTVDDIAQEVYLAFYRSTDRIPDDVGNIRWLKGIARNLTMNHFRRANRQRERQMAAIAELLSRTDEGAAALEESARESGSTLLECVGKLSDRSRRLLSLRYERNLTSEQIADLVRSKATAVRVALLRIRGLLRDCMSGRAMEEPSA